MKRMLLSGLSFLLLVGCTGGPQAKYPIDKLVGNYSVAAYHFWDVVEKDGSVSTYAVTLANNMAEYLRQQGQQAYVADLGGEAVVAVGSYPSPEAATSAAEGLAKALAKSVGGPQVMVGGARAPVLGIQPSPVDLRKLKERSQRLRHLHP